MKTLYEQTKEQARQRLANERLRQSIERGLQLLAEAQAAVKNET